MQRPEHNKCKSFPASLNTTKSTFNASLNCVLTSTFISGTMVLSTISAFSLLLIAGQATAMALGPERRGLQVCFANEAQTLFCYKKPQSTPQDVKVADMVYAAEALREYGTGTQMKVDDDGNPVLDENGIPIEVPLYRFLNMTTSTAGDCGEWTIFSDAETVLVTAKLMTKKTNGLVVSYFRRRYPKL